MTTLAPGLARQPLRQLQVRVRTLSITLIVLAVALLAVGALVVSGRLAPPANAITPEVRAVVDDYLAAWNDYDGDAFRSMITDNFEFGWTGDEAWSVDSVESGLVSAQAVEWHAEVIGQPVMFVSSGDQGVENTVVTTIRITGIGEHYNHDALATFLVVDDAGTLKVAAQWLIAYPDI